MNTKKFLLWTFLTSSLILSGTSCSNRNKKDKEDVKKEIKKQEDLNYGSFKKRMQKLTPQIMLETILSEGVKLDENGLCRPYKDSKGKWTIGFGLTVLDGQPVTSKTRHITLQEAWEKSVHFYESYETYFFMWCYEIGIDGLQIDSKEKALALASVMYNANTNFIEDTDIKRNPNHANRNNALRQLYKQYGDNVTVDQVKAVFKKYPIKKPYSFYRALNGGTTEDWANSLGNFCQEKHGIYWRRWLQGQIALGNITYKELLDLPMLSMYDFWCIIGGNKVKGGNKAVVFTTNKDGSVKVNPEALKKFKEWAKNPVTKEGKKNPEKTLRQILNMIDPTIVEQIEKGEFVSKYNCADDYGNTIEYVAVSVEDSKEVGVWNDKSVYSYKAKDYKKSLDEAKKALEYSTTNKEFGASYYNMGVAYLALHRYNDAESCFVESLKYNETNAAKSGLELANEKLQEQQQKQQQKRKAAGNVALGIGIGVVGAGAAALAWRRRKNLMVQQKFFSRRK